MHDENKVKPPEEVTFRVGTCRLVYKPKQFVSSKLGCKLDLCQPSFFFSLSIIFSDKKKKINNMGIYSRENYLSPSEYELVENSTRFIILYLIIFSFVWTRKEC